MMDSREIGMAAELRAAPDALRAQPQLLLQPLSELIAWCRQHLPSAVKVVESVLKSEINAHIKTTGECPDGAELAGGGEKFYVK